MSLPVWDRKRRPAALSITRTILSMSNSFDGIYFQISRVDPLDAVEYSEALVLPPLHHEAWHYATISSGHLEQESATANSIKWMCVCALSILPHRALHLGIDFCEPGTGVRPGLSNVDWLV